jgi:hypothetical protein
MQAHIEIFLPMSISPLERGERFELPLCDLLDEVGGDITNSGSLLDDNKKIKSCSIALKVNDLDAALPRIIDILSKGAAAPGTVINQLEPNHKQLFLL